MNTEVTIDQLMANHDTDPALAGQQIRGLLDTGVDENDLPRFAWLINHVIGELLHGWPEAHQLQRKLQPHSKHRAVLRHRAVAALCAGAPLDAWNEQVCLSLETGASRAQAEVAIRLGVLQHEAANVHPDALVQVILPLFAEMQEWRDYGPLGDIFAASLNNIISGLLDHKELDITNSKHCDVMEQGSRLCRQIWQTAGSWLHCERADYLVAIACNRIGNWPAAADAAQAGLNTIASNGVEEVDQAFLLLELARAQREMGRQDEHIVSRNAAFALAERFDEDGLREWFDSRAAA